MTPLRPIYIPLEHLPGPVIERIRKTQPVLDDGINHLILGAVSPAAGSVLIEQTASNPQGPGADVTNVLVGLGLIGLGVYGARAVLSRGKQGVRDMNGLARVLARHGFVARKHRSRYGLTDRRWVLENFPYVRLSISKNPQEELQGGLFLMPSNGFEKWLERMRRKPVGFFLPFSIRDAPGRTHPSGWKDSQKIA